MQISQQNLMQYLPTLLAVNLCKMMFLYTVEKNEMHSTEKKNKENVCYWIYFLMNK